jgi:hypothetical protein
MLAPVPVNIQDWLDYQAPHNTVPHTPRGAAYWNLLAQPANNALRDAIVEEFTLHYGANPGVGQPAQQIAIIQEYQGLFTDTAAHPNSQSVLYRIADVEVLHDQICTNLLPGAMAGADNSRAEILNLMANLHTHLASNVPNTRLVALRNDPVIGGTRLAATVGGRAVLDTALDDINTGQMRIDARLIELHFQAFLTEVNLVGNFVPALGAAQQTALKIKYIEALEDDAVLDGAVAVNLAAEIQLNFGWTLTPGQNINQVTAAINTARFAGVDEDFIEDVYGGIEDVLYDVLNQHPDATEFFGTERRLLSNTEGVYQPDGHTLDKNMLWVVAGANTGGRNFHFASDLTIATILRRTLGHAHHPSAFANEVAGLREAGYTMRRQADGSFQFRAPIVVQPISFQDVRRDMRDVFHRLQVLDSVADVVHEQEAQLQLAKTANLVILRNHHGLIGDVPVANLATLSGRVDTAITALGVTYPGAPGTIDQVAQRVETHLANLGVLTVQQTADLTEIRGLIQDRAVVVETLGIDAKIVTAAQTLVQLQTQATNQLTNAANQGGDMQALVTEYNDINAQYARRGAPNGGDDNLAQLLVRADALIVDSTAMNGSLTNNGNFAYRQLNFAGLNGLRANAGTLRINVNTARNIERLAALAAPPNPDGRRHSQ